MNFSVTVSAPDDVASLNMSQQNFGEAAGEAESSLAETSEDVAAAVVMDVGVDDIDSGSGLVAYTVVKCDDDVCAKEECQDVDAETSVAACMTEVASFS